MTRQEHYEETLQEVYYYLDSAYKATLSHSKLEELRSLIKDAKAKTFDLIGENDKATK